MSKERLQECKDHVSRFLYLPQDSEWLISEVERLQAKNNKLRNMREIVANAHQDTLENFQQKVERLEKALKEIKERSIGFARIRAKQALETEEQRK
jgi:predicted translin family RNA/ssDNA-binding protein